jgi:hypothetical protein
MSRKNNTTIKKSGELSEFTKERVNTLLKCARDPIYFIRNFIKIKHPKRGIIPFNLHPYQEKMVTNYKNNRFNIVTASRQVGKCVTGSTTITVLKRPNLFKLGLLFVLDRAKFHEAKRVFYS